MKEKMALNKQSDDLIDLPPGFRFHPTDEEIISHYLQPRAINNKFTAYAVSEVDLNRVEPWEMPNKARMGEKEWYFFCQKDRKYPTGTRTNRATKSGYWKATGKDKEIYKGKGGSQRPESIIGMKKTLVFYMGRAPKGEKTNWVMHEYRLEGKFPQYYKLSKDEWVVCRVFHKTTGIKRGPVDAGQLVSTFIDDMLDEENSPPPPLMDPSTPSGGGGGPSSSSFTDCGGGDYEHKMTAEIVSRDEFGFPTNSTNYYCPPTYNNNNSINNNNYPMISPSPGINHCSFQRPHHHHLLGLNQCKVEYSLSNNNSINLQGSVSQNAGISTDVNNATQETSSIGISKQEIMSSNQINNTTMTMMMLNKEFEMDGLADLECLWDL